jgi:hypothetical protein
MANASIIAPQLSAWVADESPASLRVSGMCDLEQGRAAHVYWCDSVAVAEGDTVSFKFTDSGNVTPPDEIVPTDSPEHVEEQRAFAESLKDSVPDGTPAVRTRPGLSFEYRLNGQPAALASLVGGEEHILCSLLWIRQRPDQCRIAIRTFGDKGRPEQSPATEWLRATLALNDEFSVRIAA